MDIVVHRYARRRGPSDSSGSLPSAVTFHTSVTHRRQILGIQSRIRVTRGKSPSPDPSFAASVRHVEAVHPPPHPPPPPFGTPSVRNLRRDHASLCKRLRNCRINEESSVFANEPRLLAARESSGFPTSRTLQEFMVFRSLRFVAEVPVLWCDEDYRLGVGKKFPLRTRASTNTECLRIGVTGHLRCSDIYEIPRRSDPLRSRVQQAIYYPRFPSVRRIHLTR